MDQWRLSKQWCLASSPTCSGSQQLMASPDPEPSGNGNLRESVPAWLGGQHKGTTTDVVSTGIHTHLSTHAELPHKTTCLPFVSTSRSVCVWRKHLSLESKIPCTSGPAMTC